MKLPSTLPLPLAVLLLACVLRANALEVTVDKPTRLPPVHLNLPDWRVVENSVQPDLGKYIVKSDAPRGVSVVSVSWNLGSWVGRWSREAALGALGLGINNVTLSTDVQPHTVDGNDAFYLSVKTTVDMTLIHWNCNGRVNVYLAAVSTRGPEWTEQLALKAAESARCTALAAKPSLLTFTAPSTFREQRHPGFVSWTVPGGKENVLSFQGEFRWLDPSKEIQFLTVALQRAGITGLRAEGTPDRADDRTWVAARGMAPGDQQILVLSMLVFCENTNRRYRMLWTGEASQSRGQAREFMATARCPVP